MPKAFDLERESRQFANTLTDLLNKTICDGIRLTAVLEPAKRFTVLGYGVTKENRDSKNGIPIVSAKTCKTYLGVLILLEPDRDGQYLMVRTSAFGLAVDPELTDELFRYDYERDKEGDYPDAHLQVTASSDHWRALGPDKALKKLHLPVGGRRFRPTLEDIIEFLIAEGFAQGRDGWKEVIDSSRHDFQMRQLGAAVRNYPDVAIAQLRRDGRIDATGRLVESDGSSV